MGYVAECISPNLAAGGYCILSLADPIGVLLPSRASLQAPRTT